jgi:toxin FitB
VILLDTNAISELMKPKPEPKVFAWVAAQSPQTLFTTAINQAEILAGIALLPKGKRRDQLTEAAAVMFDQIFASRIVAFDSSAAEHFAIIAAARRKSGRPIAQLDAQIAAIASAHRASIATRNVADFADCGIPVIDPWSPKASPQIAGALKDRR